MGSWDEGRSWLLVFLFSVALHLFLLVAVLSRGRDPRPALAIDAAAIGLAILAEPLMLIVAGRWYHSRTASAGPVPDTAAR